MPIPDGGFRLHWDASLEEVGGDTVHVYEDFECLDDALERAAKVYGMSEGTLTRLENWFGEDACPADHLLPIAKLRSDAACDRHARQAELAAMESNPLYGTF
jgi:hypothetical protein